MQSSLFGQALPHRPVAANVRCNKCNYLLVRNSGKNAEVQKVNPTVPMLLASSFLLSGAPAQAADVVSQIADGDIATLPTAVAGLGAIGVLGATLIATDPDRR
jgi:hypothetical protein